MKTTNERYTYSTFTSCGFLRVKRHDTVTGMVTQIGSFASGDAWERAQKRIAEDKASMAETDGSPIK